ncbi:carboxylesterase/lipase family protein [Microbacterium sp. SMR1]|uniref:carboxylesterase/lipase family protein n=1 Tax=Microbacterium sp. SMR1 TaxID=1497340 RepID=UPI000DCD8C27|nr:carboxylesterase family protein [Microbacterium sp. SMR1]RAZ31289.1 carboxylesterase/lipase family protein [Microbacterium sp. SMR1]
MPEEVVSDEARVSIGGGELRGSRLNGVDRYLGIPYAKPPVGERRFRVAEPVDPWDGERDATRFGPTAPQTPYPGDLGELLTVPTIEGDDILTVNVWAPVGAADAPVVLWLHGGALERGAAAQTIYDGTTFARDGIVFVSANYRLGVEGFSVLDGVPRNLGLRDAAAALRWVSDEIRAFGGDPARITLMGESAGGALVAALVSEPRSRALVAGAIIQSGPLEAAEPDKARRASDAIARELGIPTTRESFAATSTADLLSARSRASAGSSPLRGAPGFVLALDDESLPEVPEVALTSAELPIVIGTNTDEYRLWLTPDAIARIGRLKAWVARRAMGVSERAARAVARSFPGASPGEVLGQLLTDRMLRAPATRVARARTAPTFVYEFAWRSPVRGLDAAHALEIGFTFDRLGDPEALLLAGPDAPADLARDMHAAWVDFIRSGDPGWAPFSLSRMTRIWDAASRDLPQRRVEVIDALS